MVGNSVRKSSKEASSPREIRPNRPKYNVGGKMHNINDRWRNYGTVKLIYVLADTFRSVRTLRTC